MLEEGFNKHNIWQRRQKKKTRTPCYRSRVISVPASRSAAEKKRTARLMSTSALNWFKVFENIQRTANFCRQICLYPSFHGP